MMLRSGAGRSALRSLVSAASSVSRTPVRSTFSKAQLVSPLGSASARRPQLLSLVAYRPISASVQRYASLGGIDRKHEEALSKLKLQAHPDTVAAGPGAILDLPEEKDIDMLKGVKADMVRLPFAVSLSLCGLFDSTRKHSVAQYQANWTSSRAENNHRNL
jgi:hypothetical protein